MEDGKDLIIEAGKSEKNIGAIFIALENYFLR
jgi:hypothetical protein